MHKYLLRVVSGYARACDQVHLPQREESPRWDLSLYRTRLGQPSARGQTSRAAAAADPSPTGARRSEARYRSRLAAAMLLCPGQSRAPEQRATVGI